MCGILPVFYQTDSYPRETITSKSIVTKART